MAVFSVTFINCSSYKNLRKLQKLFFTVHMLLNLH